MLLWTFGFITFYLLILDSDDISKNILFPIILDIENLISNYTENINFFSNKMLE